MRSLHRRGRYQVNTTLRRHTSKNKWILDGLHPKNRSLTLSLFPKWPMQTISSTARFRASINHWLSVRPRRRKKTLFMILTMPILMPIARTEIISSKDKPICWIFWAQLIDLMIKRVIEIKPGPSLLKTFISQTINPIIGDKPLLWSGPSEMLMTTIRCFFRRVVRNLNLREYLGTAQKWLMRIPILKRVSLKINLICNPTCIKERME